MQSDHGNVLRISRRTSLRLSRRTQPGTPLAIATLSWARVKGDDGRLTHRALKPLAILLKRSRLFARRMLMD